MPLPRQATEKGPEIVRLHAGAAYLHLSNPSVHYTLSDEGTDPFNNHYDGKVV